MKYADMASMWIICAAMLFYSQTEDTKKLKELIYLACVLIGIMSVIICIYSWIIESYRKLLKGRKR